MKLSEFMEKFREAYLERSHGFPPNSADIDALKDAAEGLKWDPEEPELPERVAWDEDHRLIRQESGLGRGWFIANAFTGISTHSNHPGREWQEGAMREAVRRYNLVGEVVKEMEEASARTLRGSDDVYGALASDRFRSIYRKLKGGDA